MFLLALAVVCQSDTILRGQCETGWVSGPYPANSCYLFSVATSTWSGAQQFCRNLGGHLAILDSMDEIMWMRGVRSFYPQLQNTGQVFVGGFKESGSGQWLWQGNTTNYPILASDWGVGQPDNASPGQSCLALFSKRTDRDWGYRFDDFWCSRSIPFICEKKVPRCSAAALE